MLFSYQKKMLFRVLSHFLNRFSPFRCHFVACQKRRFRKFADGVLINKRSFEPLCVWILF